MDLKEQVTVNHQAQNCVLRPLAWLFCNLFKTEVVFDFSTEVNFFHF